MARKPKCDPAKAVRTVCERISEGELVAQVIAEIGITRVDLYRWTEADDELRKAYARARELQAHAVAEQALLAAHGMDDYAEAVRRVLEWEDDKVDSLPTAQQHAARSFVNSLRNAAVQRDKLRCDALKWTASKLAPRDYGERVQADVTSGNKPLRFTLALGALNDGDG